MTGTVTVVTGSPYVPYMLGNNRVKMKYLWVLFLLLQGGIPLFAQHIEDKNCVYTVLSDSTVVLTTYQYNGNIDWKNDCLSIDSMVVHEGKHYRVVAIGEKAFQSDNHLLQAYLNNVKQVFLPETVKEICSDAFYNRFNSLQRISFPGSLEVIGNNSFASLPSLSEISIKSVNGTGDWAFSINPSLARVYMDSCVVSIGKSSFFKCTRLNNVNLEYVFHIDEHAFESTSLENLLIPKCKIIGDFAFADCRRIDRIIFSDELQQISDYAFLNNTALKGLDVHSGWIGEGAFMGCTSLQSVFLSDSVASIGQAAFGGCSSLVEVELPSNLQRIEALTFMDCKSLKSIVIPESVAFIGEAAFFGAGIAEITIPASVLKIERDAFQNCKNLKKVILYCSDKIRYEDIFPKHVEIVKKRM